MKSIYVYLTIVSISSTAVGPTRAGELPKPPKQALTIEQHQPAFKKPAIPVNQERKLNKPAPLQIGGRTTAGISGTTVFHSKEYVAAIDGASVHHKPR